jgi:glycosyltransferase involved in cell wall biosynthesis
MVLAMDKIKILKIATIPGSLKVLLNGQFSFLHESGFEVYTLSGPGTTEPDYLVNDQKVKKHFSIDLTRSINPFTDLKAVYQCYKAIKEIKPQIVHTYTPKAGLVGMLAAFLARVPIKMHNITGLPLMEATGAKKTMLIWIERLIYWLANYVYSNSFGMLEYIKEHIYNSNKIKVLGYGSTNGINTLRFKSEPTLLQKASEIKTQFGINPNEFVWLFVGRIVGDKGINELLEAFEESQKTFSSKLLLVGDFEKELDPISEKSLEILTQNKNIIQAGFQEDVRPYFLASDCLLFPSYREGLPNVPMQAACFGKPTIATNINGCNEVIEHDANGLLIKSKSAEELLSAMKLIYSDTKLRDRLGTNAREIIVKKYEQQNVWRFLTEEYKRVIDLRYGA